MTSVNSQSQQIELFELESTLHEPDVSVVAWKIRTEEPERRQGTIKFEMPEDALEPLHPARLLWTVLGTLDLVRFGEDGKAVVGQAGRCIKSPRMMLTLWMYAISRGIGSAREIARMIQTDSAFCWIVGDVKVGHHALSSFRTSKSKAFEILFTDILGSLMDKGLLSLDLVAIDGTRTRASASAPSFRRHETLKDCQEQALLHLKAVLADADNPEHTQAQHARRHAAAQDKLNRVNAAIETVQALQAERSAPNKEARASTTDHESRVMKMGDGGFRPAYNVRYGVAGSPLGGPRTIVGVMVDNIGNDMGTITPMAQQIQERTGHYPDTILADGGFAKHDDIEATTKLGIEIIVPPKKNAKPIADLESVSPEVLAWRVRMETEAAKKAYKARAGLCELANAHQKGTQKLTQFLVRGTRKATNAVLLCAISANILTHASNLI